VHPGTLASIIQYKIVYTITESNDLMDFIPAILNSITDTRPMPPFPVPVPVINRVKEPLLGRPQPGEFHPLSARL
jgi:hypothetical protein